MDNKKKKKSIKTKAQKAIVTQANRFIYAKYDMNANELKFFLWIVAQIDSQKDQLFQICEIPLSEMMQVWQWKDTSEGYKYVRDLCYSMGKKAYVEDFRLLDEKTMKEVRVFQVMPLFKFIKYQEGQGFVSYQLNDSLMEYILDQKRDFTQIKFDDIQQMKSAYSIRIYNMLMCEIKQNRQTLKINLSVLQNILEVPKSLLVWQDFKRKVLEQAEKDINAKSNLILFDIKTYKTGRKITEIEFSFDYKNNDKRWKREAEKHKKMIEKMQKIIAENFIGKSVATNEKNPKILTIESMSYNEKTQAIDLLAKPENSPNSPQIRIIIKECKDLKNLEKAKKRAESLFYLDKETRLNIQENRQLSFDNLYKKI